MAVVYVSLGSACNAAMMLSKAGLRDRSLPFDWLDNGGGLAEVNAILEADFTTVTGPDAHAEVIVSAAGERALVFARHPGIVHLHSDPVHDPAAAADLDRRFHRLAELIAGPDDLRFVAYEAHRRGPAPDDDAVARHLAALTRQGERWLANIDRRRGADAPHRLLLVLETDPRDATAAQRIVARAASSDPRIAFAHATLRDDVDPTARLDWRRRWLLALWRHADMPLGRRLRVLRAIVSASLRLAFRRRPGTSDTAANGANSRRDG